MASMLGIGRMIASQISRICASLSDIVSDLQGRSLSEVSFLYLWLDATYIKCRDEGCVSSCVLVTAIAVDADGYRRVLGSDAFDTETYAGWLRLLRSLRDRGGLPRSCLAALHRASYAQRILLCSDEAEENGDPHYLACSVCRTRSGSRSVTLLSCMQEHPSHLEESGEILEEAEADALAYLDFPFTHHKRLRTNNVQERAIHELKRQSRVVQIFPSRKSLIRVFSAVFAEMDED